MSDDKEGIKEQCLVISKGESRLQLIQSQEVLLTTVSLKTDKESELRAALPFALEEQLSEPVELLHFAWGCEIEEGRRPVAVISKRCMDKFHVEENVSCLLPESLALPWQPDSWSVLIVGERAIIRTGEYSGFGVLVAQLNEHLRFLMDKLPVDKIELWATDETVNLGFDTQVVITTHQAPSEAGLSDWFQQYGQPAKAFNLLTGAYATENKRLLNIKHWRIPAVLLLLLFVVNIGLTWQKTAQLKQQKKVLSEEMTNIFKKAFPDVKRIVNPRVQAEQKIKAMKGAQPRLSRREFTQIFSTVLQQLRQQGPLDLQTVIWKNGRLELQIEALSGSLFSTSKSRLKEQGIEMTIMNIEKMANNVRLKMTFQKVKS